MFDPVHYKATVEYDGTNFHGFQMQRQERTVQGELEAALQRLNKGQPLRVRAAGRTDRGVHATGQVIDFYLAWPRDDSVLLRAINAILPEDVGIRTLERATADFHPRFSALARAYRYTIWNHPQRSPLARQQALHVATPLDVDAMSQALAVLVGTHDFASFGLPTQGEVTIRNMYHATTSGAGPWVWVDLEANGFLYRMVRTIVGSLLPIGAGDRPPEWLGEVLAARDRGAAGTPVAPQGLCLTAVRYEPPISPARFESLEVPWQH